MTICETMQPNLELKQPKDECSWVWNEMGWARMGEE